jgi:hypothetical protein
MDLQLICSASDVSFLLCGWFSSFRDDLGLDDDLNASSCQLVYPVQRD